MPPTNLNIENTYEGVSRYSSNKMVLSPGGMRELRSRISFTQLRFHCHKQQHGRTFHVKTAANSSGEAVARFFAGDTDVFPKACGSFEKLKGDNSVLASRCAEWGKKNGAFHVGKWGHEGQKEICTQHSLRVTIIGTPRQTMTDGNVMTLRKICRAVTFGRFTSGNLCNALRLFRRTSRN